MATEVLIRHVAPPTGAEDPNVRALADIFARYNPGAAKLRFQTERLQDPIDTASAALHHQPPAQVVLSASLREEPDRPIGFAQVRGASADELAEIYERAVDQAEKRRRRDLEAREGAWIAALEQRSERPIQHSNHKSLQQIEEEHRLALVVARRNRREGRKSGEITLDVHPDAQGKGVGKELMERALATAPKIPGVRAAEFVIDRGNRAMTAIARKVGAQLADRDDSQRIYQIDLTPKTRRSARSQPA